VIREISRSGRSRSVLSSRVRSGTMASTLAPGSIPVSESSTIRRRSSGVRSAEGDPCPKS
jgi:hypothetical protein